MSSDNDIYGQSVPLEVKLTVKSVAEYDRDGLRRVVEASYVTNSSDLRVVPQGRATRRQPWYTVYN